jgi:hypothetical protein
MRLWICEQRVRLSGLDDPAGIQHHNAVIIEDGVELVRDRDYGMVAELLTNHALHDIIRFGIDAFWN